MQPFCTVAIPLKFMPPPWIPPPLAHSAPPPVPAPSPQAAELTRAYCVSVVHAKDMIPRLAVATMEQLVQVGAECRGTRTSTTTALACTRPCPYFPYRTSSSAPSRLPVTCPERAFLHRTRPPHLLAGAYCVLPSAPHCRSW